jgi:hypothetical protein
MQVDGEDVPQEVQSVSELDFEEQAPSLHRSSLTPQCRARHRSTTRLGALV